MNMSHDGEEEEHFGGIGATKGVFNMDESK
jgi:hypothetical protein